MSDRTHRST